MAGRKKHTTNGPVNYERPEILIRTRQGRPQFEYDHDEADRLLAESMIRGGFSHLPPKGRCYDCDKPVTPMRKLCGKCLVKREGERWR